MTAIQAGNTIKPFGYCVRGCGRRAVRIEAMLNGDLLCLCDDRPRCRPAGAEQIIPAYCDPENVVCGTAYDPGLDVKEIARRMRKAIKDELPGIKCSVRIKRYTGGQAISLSLEEAPFNTDPIADPADDESDDWTPRPWKEKFCMEMRQVMDRLNEIHDRWNRQNIDSASDFFDVTYYGSVTDPAGRTW